MEVLTLCLMFFTVPGYSYILQPRTTATEIASLDGDDLSAGVRETATSEAKSADKEQGTSETSGIKDVVFSDRNWAAGEREITKMTIKRDQGGEGTNEGRTTSGPPVEIETAEFLDGRSAGRQMVTRQERAEINGDKVAGETIQTQRSDLVDKLEQNMVKEERESKLVAGITPIPGVRLVPSVPSTRIQPVPRLDSSPVPSVTASEPKTTHRLSVSAVARNQELLAEVVQSPGRSGSRVTAGAGVDDAAVMLRSRQTPNRLGAVRFVENSWEKQSAGRLQKNKPDPRAAEKASRGNRSKIVKNPKARKNNTTPVEEKTVTTPAYFPYFLDNYCPPACACYGRVVQCSDGGVDRIPYGIPYSARYVLLMNNRIDGVQPGLLGGYVSMEFLVLSNNRLTDGAIGGAFREVPALKRLYLDRNSLVSVPADLPSSLEELRLDSNRLAAISEAALVRCPDLLVLSLSNNSLGNGSEALPEATFAPLTHLRTLNLDYNQLTSVPLRLPLSIKDLYLKGNLIEQFPGEVFLGTSDLLVLDLSANRLSTGGLPKEALLNATRLESLNLAENRLRQVPRHLPLSLKTLNLEGNLISSVKKKAFFALKNLEHLGLARNKISKVVPGAFLTLPLLHQLDLCHNALSYVPRQLPRGLHSVALAHNRIQSVPRDAFCWGGRDPGLSRLARVHLENNSIDMGKLDSKAFRCLRGFQVIHFY